MSVPDEPLGTPPRHTRGVDRPSSGALAAKGARAVDSTGKEIALNLPGIAVKWALPGKLWPRAAGVPDKERKLAAEQHAHELAELHQQVETSPTTTV